MSLLGTNRNPPFGPNPGREPFGAEICHFGRPNFSCGNEPKRPFWAKSWPGAFWSSNLSFWTARGRLLNVSSRNEPKRPFWAKSWPGKMLGRCLEVCTNFWKLLASSWKLLEASGKKLLGSFGKPLGSLQEASETSKGFWELLGRAWLEGPRTTGHRHHGV